MKKIVLALLVLAALTGGLFAQSAPAVKVEGRVDAWWIPFQNAKVMEESYTGAGLGRDGTSIGPRMTLFISGGNEYIGFDFRPAFMIKEGDAQELRFEDQAHAWVQPFGDPTLKIYAGRYRENTLRGKIGANWLRHHTVRSFDEDEIFSRFSSNSFYNSASSDGNLATDSGVLITSKISDLFIGLNFPRLDFFNTTDGGRSSDYQHGETYFANNGNKKGDFARVYERTQFAIGYTIQDVGLVRAQYVGANNDIVSGTSSLGAGSLTLTPGDFITNTMIMSPRIELAFQVLALQDMGLMLDIGFKVPLAATDSNVKVWDGKKYSSSDFGGDITFKAQPSYTASLGLLYQMDAGDVKNGFKVNARFDTRFAGSAEVKSVSNDAKYEQKNPFELNVHLWPTYDLGFIILGLDVGIGYYGKYTVDVTEISTGNVLGDNKNDPGTRLGFGFFIQKNFAGTTSFLRAGLAYSVGAEFDNVKEASSFTIPVYFETRF